MLTLARHFHVHPIIVYNCGCTSQLHDHSYGSESKSQGGGHQMYGNSQHHRHRLRPMAREHSVHFSGNLHGVHERTGVPFLPPKKRGSVTSLQKFSMIRAVWRLTPEALEVWRPPYQLGLLQVPHRAFKHFLAVAATLASMSCKKGTTATVSSDKIVTICIVAAVHRAAIFSKRRSWGITMVTNCMIGQTCHHCIAGFLAGSCNGLDLVALKLDHGGQHGDEKSGRRNVLLSSDTQYKAPSRSVESTGLASFAKLFDQQGVEFELLKATSVAVTTEQSGRIAKRLSSP